MTEREHITDRAHGIDVSHWQDKYIYAKTWGQVDFAIAKLGEGYNTPYSSTSLGDWTDFNAIWDEGCAKVGIRGVYFYQRSGYSWERQATGILESINKMSVKPHMIWCDIEKGNNIIDKTMLADSLRIMDYWKANSPYLVGSYANKDIWQAYIYDIGLRYYGQAWVDRFVAYPKFYAQYWDVPSPDKQPSLAACLNGKWDIWQYTDKGDSDEFRDGTLWRRYGSPDLDVFNGTVAEMREWLGITDEPPVEPPPPEIPPTGENMNYKITVNADAAGEPNIRETGGATLGKDIGNFHKGQVGLGTEVLGSPTGQYYCLRVTSGADVSGWVYSRWNNAPTYATIEEMPIVEPPPPTGVISVNIAVDGVSKYSAEFPEGSKVSIEIS